MLWRRKRPKLLARRLAAVRLTTATVTPQTTFRLQMSGLCPVAPDDEQFPGVIGILALKVRCPDHGEVIEMHISFDAEDALAITAQMVLAMQAHLTTEALQQGLVAAFKAMNKAMREAGA